MPKHFHDDGSAYAIEIEINLKPCSHYFFYIPDLLCKALSSIVVVVAIWPLWQRSIGVVG